MTNIGRFTDRCPIICAAGKVSIPNTTVRETLQEYHLVDEVDALKHNFNIFKEKSDIPEKVVPFKNTQHRGCHDKILEHKPKIKTRYQQLIYDLKETNSSYYWKKPLGERSDAVAGLPLGMHPTETTFGIQPEEIPSSGPLNDVIYPDIPRYQVLYNSQINHDNYKKIFNDYNPGEKIDRNYLRPPYDPNNCAGHRTKYSGNGKGVACALSWFHKEPITIISKRQTDYWDKYHSKMGETSDPTEVQNCIPKGHWFGKLSVREMHGVEDLLKPGSVPSIYKRDTLENLASLNMLRQNIKKRFSATFNLTDLFNRLAQYDQDLTNFVSMEDFYEVIRCLKLNMNRENLESLFLDVGIIQSGKIDYRRFIEALNFDLEFGKQLDPLAEDKLNFCSETGASYLAPNSIRTTDKPAAGLSSYRYDLEIPPKKGCESERDNLITDDVKTLIDRSIFLQYDISYRDMFKKRSESFLKTLFENCGYQFAEGAFDELYSMALKLDQSGSVCVDTFYKVLKKNLPPMKKLVDEIDCFSYNQMF